MEKIFIYSERLDEFQQMFLERSLRKKCPYSELFWSVLPRIWTEYREIPRISPYSVRMRENTDLNNFEYGHFLGSGCGL